MTYNSWKDKLFETYMDYSDSGRLGDCVIAIRALCQEHMDDDTLVRIDARMMSALEFEIDVYISDRKYPLAMLHEQLSLFTFTQWMEQNAFMRDFTIPTAYLN